jgi:hypothetical protein
MLESNGAGPMLGMNFEYRKALLNIRARLDQIETDANAILAAPADADNLPLAEELRKLIVEMQAKVEEKLERGAKAQEQ